MKTKVAFITNICTHYVIRLFELLSEECKIDFYFTGGKESYWEKQNKVWLGKFDGRYLKGLFILPKFKITPALFNLPGKNYNVYIKTIDDRFALPFVFLLSKILKKPFILWTGHWMHPQTFFHRLSFGVTKYIYRYSDAIVVYGEHVRRYLVSLGISNEKIFIAAHSIDNTLFNKAVSEEEKAELRNQLRVSNEKIVLYVGRFEECKGLMYLIEAASLIKDIKFTLLFIGRGVQEEALKKACHERGCKAIFLDHIPNKKLYRYYAVSDVFVLPSITTRDFKEPWGLVINEAMNQGCPVIATDAVGAAAGGLVENKINGLIVPEKNTVVLKEALETLLQDEGLRRRLGQNAKEKIKNWTPEKTTKGFIRAVEFVS